MRVVERSGLTRGAAPPATRVAMAIAVAHGVTDAYASLVPPLLPRIMSDLGLSIALAATLSVTYGIAAALPQPLFGYLADLHGRRVFAVGGMVLGGVFMALVGLAPGFWPLLAVLVLGGLGSAAFHPAGASYAVRIGAGRGGGVRYGMFALGGAIGFALGPLAAVGLVQWRGMQGLGWAMIPALLLAAPIFLLLPSGRGEVRRERVVPPGPGEVLGHLVGPLGFLFGISAIMAFIQRVFLTMEPIIVADSGGSETLGAVALSVYLGAQSAGTVLGGVLADRMHRGRLLLWICLASVPTHLLAVGLGPHGVGLVAIAAAGFLGLAVLPPIVVMAQELIPNGASVGSGIVMGLAWAAGSIGVLGTGALADGVGARSATLLSIPVILVAALLATHPSLEGVAHPGG